MPARSTRFESRAIVAAVVALIVAAACCEGDRVQEPTPDAGADTCADRCRVLDLDIKGELLECIRQCEAQVETIETGTCDGSSGILSSGDLVFRYGCP